MWYAHTGHWRMMNERGRHGQPAACYRMLYECVGSLRSIFRCTCHLDNVELRHWKIDPIVQYTGYLLPSVFLSLCFVLFWKSFCPLWANYLLVSPCRTSVSRNNCLFLHDNCWVHADWVLMTDDKPFLTFQLEVMPRQCLSRPRLHVRQ